MKELFTSVQTNVLVELGTYFYLTRQMMLNLGVGSDDKNLRLVLDTLRRKGYITRQKQQPQSKQLGSLPYLYNLLEPGALAVASILGQPPEDVKMDPYRGVDQLPHLMWIIETHIAFRRWAAASGVAIEWWKGEYQPGLEGGAKATTLYYPALSQSRFASKPWYTADAVTEIVPADGKPRLVVIEVYRGGWRYDLGHFRKKLPILRRVAESGALEAHFGGQMGARYLILFSDQAMRDQALSEWPDQAAPIWGRFMVKHMGELDDFNANWKQPGRPPRSMI